MWFFRSECDKISERLWDYTAQRLSAVETAQIESHLALCAHCQTEADSYRQTLRMLSATRSLPVPASQTSWQELRPRLAPAIAARHSGLRSADLLPRLTLAGAGTALAATLLVVFFSGGHPPAQVDRGTMRSDQVRQTAPNGRDHASSVDTTVAQNDAKHASSDGSVSGMTLGAFFDNRFAQLRTAHTKENSGAGPTPKPTVVNRRNFPRITRRTVPSTTHGRPAATSEESAAQLDGDNVTPRTQQNYVLNPVTPSADEEPTHRYVMGSIPTAQNSSTVASNEGTEEGRAW
jgi:hypothetical protein